MKTVRTLKLLVLICVLMTILKLHSCWSDSRFRKLEIKKGLNGASSHSRVSPSAKRMTRLLLRLIETEQSIVDQLRFLQLPVFCSRNNGVLAPQLPQWLSPCAGICSNSELRCGAIETYVSTLSEISRSLMFHRQADKHSGYGTEITVSVIYALDKNFCKRLMRNIRSAFNAFPNSTIIVYDLGLTSQQVVTLKTMNCVVETFPFQRFPDHVANLKNFAFKPLVIQLALKHHGPHIIYGDTSVSYSENIDWNLIFEDNSQRGLAVRELPSMYLPDYTDSAMFEWFRENPEDHKYTVVSEAGLVIASDNNILAMIMKAWVHCALHVRCIDSGLSSNNVRHRYDQSALTLVLSYYFFPPKCRDQVFEPAPYDAFISVPKQIALVIRD